MNSFKDHVKYTAVLAFPVSVGQLGHIAMGVADSMMVGRIGAVPLAASSIANGLFFLIFVFGLGISFAISPLVSILLGSDKTKETGQIFTQGLILNIVMGTTLFLVIFFAADLIFYFNQPADVAAYAVSYLKIVSFSALPMLVFQSYKQFIEGFGVMRPAMFVVLIANLSNIFGNWLLIYGNWGFPKLGLDGAGISTTINRCLMAAMMMTFVIKAEDFKPYEITKVRGVDFHVMKKILALGIPVGFQLFFESAAFNSVAVLIGWIGTIELAAHQIALNLASVTFMIITGIAAAASIRVGSEVGKKDITQTRRAGFSAIILAASIMAFFGLNFIVLNKFLPSLYINDPRVISIASTLLIIAAIFQVFDGTQSVSLGALRGITDAKVPTAITFIAYWVLGLPSGYLMAFNFGLGVYGIWIGFIIGLIASAVMLVLRFNIKSKKLIEI